MRLLKIIFVACVLPLFLIQTACKRDKKNEPFTLRIRIPSEATAFNPLLGMTGHSRFVCQDIFYTLGTVDYETLEMKPLMVKKLPEARKVIEGPNQGALAYDFELWEEAVWDDGKPITAEDFVFSLKLLFHPYLPTRPWRGYFEQVQDVQIDSDNSKKFTVFLKEYYILGLESLCQFPIFPAHHYDPEGALKNTELNTLLDENQATVWIKTDSVRQKEFSTFFTSQKTITDTEFIMGAGPYKVTSVRPGDGTILEKKNPWWGDAVGEKNPYLAAYPERVIYRFLKDEGAVENTLRNGDLDVVPSIAMEKFLTLSKDTSINSKYDFKMVDFLGYNYWLLNNQKPIFSDKKVRQALAHLVDYEFLKEEVYKGLYRQISGPIHPGKPYFNENIIPYSYNEGKAKELLAEAGWTDSDGDGVLDKILNGRKQNFEFTVIASNKSLTSKAIAESVQKTCKKVGINAKIDWVDIRMISRQSRTGNYDCALLATAQFPGMDDLYQTLHTESFAPAGDNRSGYSSPITDDLIEKIRVESDASKRTVFYKELQEVLFEDVPVVFIGCPKERVIVSKRFDAAISSNRPNYVAPFFSLKE